MCSVSPIETTKESQSQVTSIKTDFIFSQKDPLISFLTSKKLNFNTQSFALFVFFWSIIFNIAVPTVIIALMRGTYGANGWLQYLHSNVINGSIFINIIFPPLLAGYYFWLSSNTDKLFQEMFSSGILKMNDTEHNLINKQLNKLYGHRWAILAIIFTITFITAWYLMLWKVGLPQFGSVNMPESNREMIKNLLGKPDIGDLTSFPWFIMGAYWAFMLIIRVIQNIFGLLIVFKNASVYIEPLHPDKCGGLSVVNRYVTRLSYLIAGCGFSLGFLTLQSLFQGWNSSLDVWIFILIGLYLILAPTFFFFSLGSAHKAMQTAKNTYLSFISKKYQIAYDQVSVVLNKEVSEDKVSQIKEQMEHLDQLDNLYKRTDAFPVWPLDIGSILRFFRVVVLSLAPTVVGIVLKIMAG